MADTAYTDESVVVNVTYTYFVSALDFVAEPNESASSNTVSVRMSGLAVDEGSDIVPTKFALRQNYPNPFNPYTAIEYDLPRTVDVRITIYNILGQEVMTLVNARQDPVHYAVTWDGRNKNGNQVATGIYVYEINAGTFRKVRKMLLLR